jgi:hypothetical protein
LLRIHSKSGWWNNPIVRDPEAAVLFKLVTVIITSLYPLIRIPLRAPIDDRSLSKLVKNDPYFRLYHLRNGGAQNVQDSYSKFPETQKHPETPTGILEIFAD